MRIVSLLPSATEIVCALGLGEAIVTSAMPSAAIDARIREQLHRGMSVYHLDEAALSALAPDLILTQELCEVCAPSFTEVRQAARVLEGRTRRVSLEPHGLDDILETILEVGRQTATRTVAEALVGQLRARIDSAGRDGTTSPRFGSAVSPLDVEGAERLEAAAR
jgi:iron complex transport system substrate-binding protein